MEVIERVGESRKPKGILKKETSDTHVNLNKWIDPEEKYANEINIKNKLNRLIFKQVDLQI